MIKLGYSLGGSNYPDSLKERIKILLEFGREAVEVSYIIVARLEDKFDHEDIKLLKRFKFISIHAPVLISKDEVNGEKNSSSIIQSLLKTAKTIGAKAILFHPDLVDDISWLNKQVGRLLAFENMDKDKLFGRTVNDFKEIFRQAPQAKWVCDLNHIYTIDPSMKLARNFHQAFGRRLSYYHLSAYGAWHDCFYNTGEDIILSGLEDFSVPIIHEGGALREGRESLKKENDYILAKLAR
jgi:endonuclease IV